MSETRYKDRSWELHTNIDGTVPNSDAVLAVQMDIRDELKQITSEMRRLNTLLHCSNFVGIPAVLRSIQRNTTKPKKRKAK